MIRVLDISQHFINVRTRMPFRYGIATVTELPHLFLRAFVEIDGKRQLGVSAEHLPPKWFTKNADLPIEQDIADLRSIISQACTLALQIAPARTVFGFWREVYTAVTAAAEARGDRKRFPPLVAGLGISLIERAVIDAFCRRRGVRFHEALRSNAFGIEYAGPPLEPGRPLDALIIRHTVGLSDPLTNAEINRADRLDDGLPQSLEACIRAYGLTHFKIKLGGDAETDITRLRDLDRLLVATGGVRFTLDGNESYDDVESLRGMWAQLLPIPLMRGLIALEQPLHRDVALSEGTARAMRAWADRPKMIIDESDDTLSAGQRALDCGYAGTSYKSCKGVIKGILTAATMRAAGALLTAEDLSTIGPISLLQDLAVVSALAIAHVERNGQHYFRGLAGFSPGVGKTVLDAHPDLFCEADFVTLRIERGSIAVRSVCDAPFGCGFDFDPESVSV